MTEIQAIVHALTSEQRASVLATLVSAVGSSYRRPGARLLLTPEGRKIGSISGGCLEEDVLAHAQRVALSGRPELVTYDTTSENDLVWGVGLGCHGVVQVLVEKLPPRPEWSRVLAERSRAHQSTELAVVWRSADSSLLGTHLVSEISTRATNVSVFFDTIAPPVRLAIFGAGDDAQPLVRLAKELGWHVTVGDPRPDFATAERFPTADAVHVAPATELADRIFGSIAKTGAPHSGAAVVMTHHYVHDVPLLRDLLPRPLQYLGVLGPKLRAEKMLGDLAREGLIATPEQRSRIYAPVGLDLGAETPEEVALSIVSEIQATLAGRNARPLRERERPIHG